MSQLESTTAKQTCQVKLDCIVVFYTCCHAGPAIYIHHVFMGTMNSVGTGTNLNIIDTYFIQNVSCQKLFMLSQMEERKN